MAATIHSSPEVWGHYRFSAPTLILKSNQCIYPALPIPLSYFIPVIHTGWDTKIRNLLFGLFWLTKFRMWADFCLLKSKQAKQKVPDFGIPSSVHKPHHTWECNENVKEQLISICLEKNWRKLLWKKHYTVNAYGEGCSDVENWTFPYMITTEQWKVWWGSKHTLPIQWITDFLRIMMYYK